MGIPSYFSYIVKNHLTIIKKLKDNSIQVNNLYLDCNSIIYDAVHNIDFTNLVESDDNTIIRFVCLKIKEYINILKPNKVIYIAFDGVAPIAKLKQQRARRYKSQNTSNLWNTTAITPGTVFMKKLNAEVKLTFQNPLQYNVENIICSGSDIHGEGEHKLFQFIRDFPKKHINYNTVIYGLDADLIMLSINHLPITKNIYLFRETPHFIKSINAELEPNEKYLLDIPELANIITLDMNNNKELTNEKQTNRIYDYIFLCFFLGNDFMPHFPSVNIRTGGIDKMLNAYKETLGSSNNNLTDGNKIFWKNVRKLVVYLANLEEEYLKTEMIIRNKKEKYISQDDKLKQIEFIPLYERNVEKYINPYKVNWQNRYYKTLFDIEIDDIRKKQICTNYLQGLEWTMKYYTNGCPDWRWSYLYNYPPLFSDLIHYIPYFDTEFITYKPANPVSELVQLCYVLPKQSLSLLPQTIQTKIINEFIHWYKCDCTFVWAFCTYFWESHVNLPYIDIKDLEKLVNELLYHNN